MKPFFSYTFTIILAVTLGVGQADTGKRVPQSPSVNKVTPQNKVPVSKPPPKMTDKEPWPRTFVPSEKITADSVVSFPADI